MSTPISKQKSHPSDFVTGLWRILAKSLKSISYNLVPLCTEPSKIEKLGEAKVNFRQDLVTLIVGVLFLSL